jgi:hypothetical protein
MLAWHGVILIYPYTPSGVESLARRTAIVTTFDDYDKLRIDTNHHSGIVPGKFWSKRRSLKALPWRVRPSVLYKVFRCV